MSCKKVIYVKWCHNKYFSAYSPVIYLHKLLVEDSGTILKEAVMRLILILAHTLSQIDIKLAVLGEMFTAEENKVSLILYLI